MDIKKLEKLENIRNFLENDNVAALARYVEKIKPLVKKDEDFSDIFEELNNKNYDQALLITEDIIFDMKGHSKDDDEDYSSEDFEGDDDFMYDNSDDDFGDVGMNSFESEEFFDDGDDDYY